MNRIVNFILFAWLFCPAYLHAVEVTGWSSDVTNVLKVAREKQRPVLLEFTAPWCPYCKMMESKTFKDKSVAESLEQFERASVNIDQNAELAAQHSVRGIPAFVILDPDGEEVVKTSGYMEAEPFAQWLTNGVSNLSMSATQKEEFQKSTQQIEAALGETEPVAREKGLTMLLECCERKEKLYRNFGIGKLVSLSQQEPGLVLNGLKHPGLMARIRVANLLREKIGKEFNIDPWEKAEIRERGIQEWKARLASASFKK
ncbi:MAG: thioredoxin [Pedosphaera sp.]|nr:thioredoxin [Pedosphaera sp.]